MTETNLPRRRRRRIRAAVAAVAALSLLVGIAGYRWATAPDNEERIREVAEAVATDLESARVPGHLRTAKRSAARTELRQIVAGMGSIRPRIDVGAVQVSDEGTRGRVTLEVSWTVHERKKPWRYTTQLPVTHEAGTWSGRWRPTLLIPGLEKGEVLRAVRVAADRGDIRGDGGSTLVTERQVARVGIDRSMITKGSAAADAQQLARLVDIEPEPFARAVAAAGDEAFVEGIVLRVGDPTLPKVRRGINDIDGARIVDDTMHLPPTSSFARETLGRAGPATSEIIKASQGRVREGDVVGTSGLQAKHDNSLRGTSGYEVQAVDADTAAARSLHTLDAVDGKHLRTTLSKQHQQAAEDALQDAPKASALVAIRPSDGHVLALANGPSGRGQPTATLGQYAPGSTFKTVTALAQLRAGTDPDASLSCPRTVQVDGRTFKNYDDFPSDRLGRMSLTEAIETSCNTALIGARDTVPDKGLTQAADSLGLTQDPALGVPAAMGKVPQPTSDTDAAATTIGQAQVVATPVAVATMMASVVAGKRVAPQLVPGRKPTASPPGASLTPDEADALRTMLRAVVTDGSATFLEDNPGGPVIAKTGTAEYGSDDPPRTHAWMIAAQDDLAIAVFVEDGSGGASAAGPIADEYLEAVQ